MITNKNPNFPKPKSKSKLTKSPNFTNPNFLPIIIIIIIFILALSFLKSKLPISNSNSNSQKTLNKIRAKTTIMSSVRVNETFYISHGSPMLSVDDSLPARHFLKSLGDKNRSENPKPNSILVISGHWETDEPTVTAGDRCDTIHDFYGFPDRLYKLKYPAPGAPDLAKRVQELLKSSGFKNARLDKERGLDHGAWVPLMLMYPKADIPVCQLSIQLRKDGKHHYDIGQALAPLKEEGVLIIGSGSATHNLRDLDFDAKEEVVPWAGEFDKWLEDALTSGRYEDVNNYEKKAPHAKRAHPWPDHFYPLHVAMGASGESSKAELIHRSWSLGTLSYASYKFNTAN